MQHSAELRTTLDIVRSLAEYVDTAHLPAAAIALETLQPALKERLELLCQTAARSSDGIEPKRLSLFFNILLKSHSQNIYSLQYYCLVNAIRSSLQTLSKGFYPISTTHLFIENYRRILGSYNLEKRQQKISENIFWKDFALATLSCFPSYGCIYEMSSGFGRLRPLWAKLTQGPKFFRMVKRLGGNTGYFEGHIHQPLIKDYKSSWEKRTLHIAEMLIAFPKCRGVFGASWMEDPALNKISPNLAKMKQEERDHGCYTFYLGRDLSGNALATSPTRRDLFERGLYVPRLYLKVWGRQDIIDWAQETTNLKI